MSKFAVGDVFNQRVLFVNLFFIVSLVFSGCSGAPKKLPTPSSLRYIALNPTVSILGKSRLRTGGEALDSVLTKLGASGPEERAKEFEQIMNSEVDIQSLLIGSVKHQFEVISMPVTVAIEHGEADLQFTVESYGLRPMPEGFKIAAMEIKATLTNRNGKIIWDDKESIDPIDQLTKGIKVRRLSEYRENLALLKTDFSSTINILIKELIQKLKEDHASGDIEN